MIAIILIPLIVGFLTFKLSPKLLWIAPLCFFGTSVFFIWETYLLNMTESGEVFYFIPIFNVNNFSFLLEFKFDFISAIIGITIFTVFFLIIIYTLGFFNSIKNNSIFALLSLLCAAMMIIIFSENIISLYIGWEFISILTYFIIAARVKKNAKTIALQAFIYNKVGDFFFLAGLILLFSATGETNFDKIFNAIALLNDNNLRIIIGLLLFGIFIKTAQFGFHIWFSDAAIAYSPTNALLSSSSTAIAGVYVLIKMFLLFEMSEDAMKLITWIGIISSIYGAVLATVQNNIKRIITYSTISQTGFMMVILSLGYPMLAILLLLFHCVYKSLLFLNIGMVVKALSTEHDIQKMGGLRKIMPISYAFMLINIIALNSFPWFAGYYIFNALFSYVYNSYILIFGILIFAFFTAIYSFRVLFKIYHGKQKEDELTLALITEKKPLMIIAISGLIIMLGIISYYGKIWFIYDNLGSSLIWLYFMVVVFGAISAFISGKAPKLQILKKIINDRRDFYELYHKIFVKPFYQISKFLIIVIDRKILGNFEKLFINNFKLLKSNFGKTSNITFIYILFFALGILTFIWYAFNNGGVI